MAQSRLPNPQFLHRRRIQVSSHTANSNFDGTGRWNISDFTERVDGAPSEVVSMELTSVIMPRCYISPFPRGSRFLDVRLEMEADPTQTLTYTIEMPPRFYVTRKRTWDVILDTLTRQMDYQNDPNFNTSNGVSWVLETDQEFADGTYGASVVTAKQYDSSTILVYFLFGSGGHADDTPWWEFGFDQGVDVGGTQVLPSGDTVLRPVPLRAVNFWKDRYVDVFVDQVPELSPHSRIFLCDPVDYINKSKKCPDGVRVLTESVHLLDVVRIRLRLANDRPIFEGANDPSSLTFDLLQVVQQGQIPSWVNQEFEL